MAGTCGSGVPRVLPVFPVISHTHGLIAFVSESVGGFSFRFSGGFRLARGPFFLYRRAGSVGGVGDLEVEVSKNNPEAARRAGAAARARLFRWGFIAVTAVAAVAFSLFGPMMTDWAACVGFIALGIMGYVTGYCIFPRMCETSPTATSDDDGDGADDAAAEPADVFREEPDDSVPVPGPDTVDDGATKATPVESEPAGGAPDGPAGADAGVKGSEPADAGTGDGSRGGADAAGAPHGGPASDAEGDGDATVADTANDDVDAGEAERGVDEVSFLDAAGGTGPAAPSVEAAIADMVSDDDEDDGLESQTGRVGA